MRFCSRIKTAELVGAYRGTFHAYSNNQAFSGQRARIHTAAGGQAIQIMLGPKLFKSPAARPCSLERYGRVDSYLLNQFDNFGLELNQHYTIDVENRIRKLLTFIRQNSKIIG